MVSNFVACCVLAALAAHAAELPSLPAKDAQGMSLASLDSTVKWWAQVGDRVYHAPAAGLGLSDSVADYYYAFGSDAALSSELRQRRVGGEGRLHIFHLPGGVPAMQLAQGRGTRRSSLSKLKQLQHGMVLSADFPIYKTAESYENPLAKSGKEQVESAAVNLVSADAIMDYLTKLTSLPTPSYPTRSARNRNATETAVQFLQAEFQALGYTACRQDFLHTGVMLTNVVAFVPGSSADTVTVGAHYDSIPPTGKAPGAEDNGSGVAALLAMAKAFKESNITPVKNVYFVAFAGEEFGCLGSESFVGQLKTADSAIPSECRAQAGGASFLQRAGTQEAIIMDEVGWRSPKLQQLTVNLEAYDWTSSLLDHLAHSSATHNGDQLVVVHSNNPFGSDHMSFLDRKMPAVLTINGDDEAYPAYHSSNDQIQNVDKDLMFLIAKMNMGALLRMAGVQDAAA